MFLMDGGDGMNEAYDMVSCRGSMEVVFLKEDEWVNMMIPVEGGYVCMNANLTGWERSFYFYTAAGNDKPKVYANLDGGRRWI
jgi:hypothetical protein